MMHGAQVLPHYRGAGWTWIKGALCTMDRDYGWFNSVFHHIGDVSPQRFDGQEQDDKKKPEKYPSMIAHENFSGLSSAATR